MRSLPPLNAVRAFEAAARHESFSRAAEELCVTAAAVSQQVKTLEGWLGVQLFRRLPRGLALTPAASAYLPRLTEALDRLAKATEAVRGASDGRVLTVSVTPGFASMWLGPRLWNFALENPELDVRLAASVRAPDFARDNVDLMIRYGRGDFPGMTSELLLADGMTPVCSPRLAAGAHPLLTPADLRHHILLHNESAVLTGFHGSWQDWLNAADVADTEGVRGLYFSDYHLAMQEAIAGRGVALGHVALVGEDLRAGRLVQPFDLILDSGGDYHAVYPPGAEDNPKVAAFLDWLRGQVAVYREGGTAEN